MKTFGEKVVEFNLNLTYDGALPPGFAVLNPFTENPETIPVMKAFYDRFYGDAFKRKFLIGINPSRHGAGVTGVPFTDTKNLEKYCGISMKSARTHEVSSVFIYDMITAYGGPTAFYRDFYINSPFPLAIVRRQKGNWVNANYYDDKNLFEEVKPFMKETIRRHISLGLETEKVFVLGKKNADFLNRINDEEHFFGEMTVLDHPRYIQQYRSKFREDYITKYLMAFKGSDEEE